MSISYDQKVLASVSRGGNRVRRALEVANQNADSSYIGARLNTRSGALVNTIASVYQGNVNKDRYIKMYQKPAIRAAFSFAIDGSDSMNYSSGTPGGNYWKECISLVHALHSSCQNMGIESSSALVMYTYGNVDVPMASTRYKPVANIKKEFKRPWVKENCNKLRKVRCGGGTSIVCYGETALDLVSSSEAEHRIAFFLTDGEDNEKCYLESMRLQALTQGIKLVGVGLGRAGSDLPNGICGQSALEIAPRMMGHLEKVIKSK
jgi:hypothetical protein